MLNINKTKNFSVLEDIIEQANEEQQSKPQRVEYIFAKYMLRDVHLEYKKELLQFRNERTKRKHPN